jgi:hypothetical protein
MCFVNTPLNIKIFLSIPFPKKKFPHKNEEKSVVIYLNEFKINKTQLWILNQWKCFPRRCGKLWSFQKRIVKLN